MRRGRPDVTMIAITVRGSPKFGTQTSDLWAWDLFQTNQPRHDGMYPAN